MDLEKFIEPFIVPPGSKIQLKDYDPAFTGEFVKKKDAAESLQKGVQELTEYQSKLYAEDANGLLIIFQALDAAGKDGAIKHIMSGFNPQGAQVYSFKAPSPEELDHDYLWRNFKVLPERGGISIFNRSYYEEVLVTRVHQDLLANEKLPRGTNQKGLWKRRFVEINNFEKYLSNNGMVIIKLFLNISRDEQKKRFLDRIDHAETNWKFSASDARERNYWGDYLKAYEDVFNRTSTEWAPWYIIPADHRWFTRLGVASVIVAKMQALNPQYPKVEEQKVQELLKVREQLLSENGKAIEVK
jgi:PPK2 family polyphosphate:nucleotide phosphotransferase